MNASKPRECDICHCELITLRRPTRTTYYCPFKDDSHHRYVRRARKFAAQTARIEAIINKKGN